MNEQELAAIEARANAATSAPWSIVVDRHHHTYIYGGPPGGRIDVAKITPWMTHDEPNATFIAHARQDIPTLIAELRRVRAELEESLFIFELSCNTLRDAVPSEIEKQDGEWIFQMTARYITDIRAQLVEAAEWIQKYDAELTAAEKVCETLEGMHHLLGNDVGPLLKNWRKVQEENKR